MLTDIHDLICMVLCIVYSILFQLYVISLLFYQALL